MATTLTVRPHLAVIGLGSGSFRRRGGYPLIKMLISGRRRARGVFFSRRMVVKANSRADDSAPFEMSVENALKVLGLSEGASFEDIVRAKNIIISSCKDDEKAVSQVEAAYDMLLMQSLSQRRAGKVPNSVRYADVKTASPKKAGSMPKWLQNVVKYSPVSVETPSTSDLGVQAGVYGALMILTYANGASSSSPAPYSGADVPGLILATSFGASLYFMTKKKVTLGKAMVITIGGLVAGAVAGSAVEGWLQVDIVPFMGIHSPATVISQAKNPINAGGFASTFAAYESEVMSINKEFEGCHRPFLSLKKLHDLFTLTQSYTRQQHELQLLDGLHRDIASLD